MAVTSTAAMNADMTGYRTIRAGTDIALAPLQIFKVIFQSVSNKFLSHT